MSSVIFEVPRRDVGSFLTFYHLLCSAVDAGGHRVCRDYRVLCRNSCAEFRRSIGALCGYQDDTPLSDTEEDTSRLPTTTPQVARLMANYIFLSEAVPVQSAAQLQAVTSSGTGKLYSLGDDVNALFFVSSVAAETSPAAATQNFLAHLDSAKKRLHPALGVALTEFGALLEARKASMGGRGGVFSF